MRERFFAALAEDFNTPTAIAVVFDWVRESNRAATTGADDLREMLGVLGLENLLDAATVQAPPEAIAGEDREQARAARDFARAERLRHAIAAAGWTVRDGPDGFELLPL